MKNYLILIAILISLQSCCGSAGKHEESTYNTAEPIDTVIALWVDSLSAIADTNYWCDYCFSRFDEKTVLCVNFGQCNADATLKIFALEEDVPKCVFETWSANSYFMKYGNKIYRWSSHMDVDWYTLIEEKDGKIVETIFCRTELEPGKGYVVTDGDRNGILNLDPKQEELQWKSFNH